MVFENWRKRRGLDYKGWWIYILQRWMLQHYLGFLIPFTFRQDNYFGGVQSLYVWRWGRLTKEYWLWPAYRDMEILDRLRKKGITNNRILYKVIQAEAIQVKDYLFTSP